MQLRKLLVGRGESGSEVYAHLQWADDYRQVGRLQLCRRGFPDRLLLFCDAYNVLLRDLNLGFQQVLAQLVKKDLGCHFCLLLRYVRKCLWLVLKFCALLRRSLRESFGLCQSAQ